MIFYVTRTAGDGFGSTSLFKFKEQQFGFFAEDVDQNIQPTAMGHANDEFFDPLCPRMLNQLVQQGDQAFPSFQGKALLTDIFSMQIFFHAFGCGQQLQ